MVDFRDIVPWGFGGRRGRGLVRREGSPFTSLQREINRMFEDFLGGALEPFEERFGEFVPPVDVRETEKEVEISAELPGIDEKDIEVTVGKDSITISGEKKEEKEEKGKGYYRMERSYGSFTRTIPLPCEIDEDKAEAKFKNGVLTITLPKTETAIKETKKIPIKHE
ncbi:MAG: Hsp20/alpha crystallin family protein [Nitrospirae bacterium]|nr:MAG: Hsp20/alpha crystallin family protein [Nitrospirota bacterium]